MPPELFVYSGEEQVFDMKVGPYNSRTIEAEIAFHDGTVITIDLLIDLGGLYPLYLPVGKYDDITLPPDAVETGLGSGLFNQKGYVSSVKHIRFGQYTLEDVKTAFTKVDKDADIFGNTMIGLPLLRKFNIVFDYFTNRIILEPSKSYYESINY